MINEQTQFKAKLNAAFVIKNLSLEEIELLAQYIEATLPDARIVFVKKSPFRLLVSEQTGESLRGDDE